MPYDGAGNFTRSYNFTADKVAGIKIQSVRVDGECDNYATAFNQVLLRNGVVPMAGNLKMGANSITGVAAGSAPTPSVSFNGDVTTGFFSPGAGIIGFAAVGVEIMRVTSTGLSVTGALATTGAIAAGAALTVAGALSIAGTTTFTGGFPANTGPFELLTASGIVSTSITGIFIALPAGYTAYKLILRGIEPAIAGPLYMRVSTDGGVTYKAGASDYRYSGRKTDTTPTTAAFGNAGTTQIGLSADVSQIITTGFQPTYEIDIFSPSAGNTVFKWSAWLVDSAGNRLSVDAGGSSIWSGINAVVAFFNSGNLTQCTWALYARRGI